MNPVAREVFELISAMGIDMALNPIDIVTSIILLTARKFLCVLSICSMILTKILLTSCVLNDKI